MRMLGGYGLLTMQTGAWLRSSLAESLFFHCGRSEGGGQRSVKCPILIPPPSDRPHRLTIDLALI